MNLANVLCGSNEAEAIPVPILFKLVVCLYTEQIFLGEINFYNFPFQEAPHENIVLNTVKSSELDNYEVQ
jgi:hypothetical protein